MNTLFMHTIPVDQENLIFNRQWNASAAGGSGRCENWEEAGREMDEHIANVATKERTK